MGMQIHFYVRDLPNDIKHEIIHDRKSDTWAYRMYIPELKDTYDITVNYSPNNKSCWQDIGMMTPYAIKVINFLVAWRIPFSAS